MFRDINCNISKSDTDVTSVNSKCCDYNIKPLLTPWRVLWKLEQTP
jgi:hypothetical protein